MNLMGGGKTMQEFNIGDEIVRVNHFTSWAPKGYSTKVLEGNRYIDNKGEVTHITTNQWELVKPAEYPNPPHVLRALIIQWANGARVGCRRSNGKLLYVKTPLWNPAFDYEIMPPEPTEIELIEAEMRKLADKLAKIRGGV